MRNEVWKHKGFQKKRLTFHIQVYHMDRYVFMYAYMTTAKTRTCCGPYNLMVKQEDISQKGHKG